FVQHISNSAPIYRAIFAVSARGPLDCCRLSIRWWIFLYHAVFFARHFVNATFIFIPIPGGSFIPKISKGPCPQRLSPFFSSTSPESDFNSFCFINIARDRLSDIFSTFV